MRSIFKAHLALNLDPVPTSNTALDSHRLLPLAVSTPAPPTTNHHPGTIMDKWIVKTKRTDIRTDLPTELGKLGEGSA